VIFDLLTFFAATQLIASLIQITNATESVKLLAVTTMSLLGKLLTVDTAGSWHSTRQGLCNGTVSVRLPVPSIDHCMSLWRVCCCGPDGQELLIDRGGRLAPQQHGIQRQMRAVPRCQLT